MVWSVSAHSPAMTLPAAPVPVGAYIPFVRVGSLVFTSGQLPMRDGKLIATGKVGRAELLAAESQSYHSPGTCTFYGTANSNQLLMEFMGLHLPGSSFVNPGTSRPCPPQIPKRTL